MIDPEELVLWAAPCGSWGGCRLADLTILREADLTGDERHAIATANDNDEAYGAVLRAAARLDGNA